MREDIDAEILKHNLSSEVVHTNLEASRCICASAPTEVGEFVRERPRSSSSGNSCASCGGITVQTGTCTTCTDCGTTGGCG